MSRWTSAQFRNALRFIPESVLHNKKVEIEKSYEILDSLPAYGPMYVPITNSDEPYFSEGFVIRFNKEDGTSWVGNFKPGWTTFNQIYNFPDRNRIIVFAGGQVYIIDPKTEKSLGSFGIAISDAFQSDDGSIICVDMTGIKILDNSNGDIWESERISWDGFKDVKFENNIISGLSFDPTNSNKEWCEFSLNIVTREINGGSYRKQYSSNTKPKPKKPLNATKEVIKTKPWWKFWEKK